MNFRIIKAKVLRKIFLALMIVEKSLQTMAKVLPRKPDSNERIPHFFCKHLSIRIYENLTVVFQHTTTFWKYFVNICNPSLYAVTDVNAIFRKPHSLQYFILNKGSGSFTISCLFSLPVNKSTHFSCSTGSDTVVKVKRNNRIPKLLVTLLPAALQAQCVLRAVLALSAVTEERLLR